MRSGSSKRLLAHRFVALETELFAERVDGELELAPAAADGRSGVGSAQGSSKGRVRGLGLRVRGV